MGKYYCYRHIRLDTNEVFYVGIGKKSTFYKSYKHFESEYKRAFSKRMRNRFWKHVITKSEYRIEIFFETESEEEVCLKEIEFIALYGRRDLGKGSLVNLTDGGDGRMNPNPETIKNNGSNWLGKRGKDNPKCKPVHMYDLSGKYIRSFDSVTLAGEHIKLDETGITMTCNIQCRMFGGYIWRFFKEDQLNESYIDKHYVRYTKVYEYDIEGHFVRVWDTIVECAKYHKVEHGNIKRICDDPINFKLLKGNLQFRYEFFNEGIGKPVFVDKGKPISMCDKNGDVIRTFKSTAEACQTYPEFGFKNISRSLNGNFNAYGYKWKFNN